MKLLFALLLLVCVSVNLSADAVIIIRGKSRKTSLRVKQAPGKFKQRNNVFEVALRPKREYQTVKISFKALAPDEFSFSIRGEYSKASSSADKQYFEWVDFNLFKVNGKELIGPGAGKDGEKSATVAKVKALKDTVKLKKREELVLEVSLRSTPREEARKLSGDANMTDEQKERLQRREKREKERLAEREKQEKAAKALEEEAAKADTPKTSSRYVNYTPAAQTEPDNFTTRRSLKARRKAAKGGDAQAAGKDAGKGDDKAADKETAEDGEESSEEGKAAGEKPAGKKAAGKKSGKKSGKKAADEKPAADENDAGGADE